MFEYHLVRCEFKMSFIDQEDYGFVSSVSTDNQTNISWKIYVGNVINGLKNDGFDFSHISQMSIIIVCNKMDVTYDFYLK